MLTAVQWRQKLGLADFRSDHVFLREVAVERMDEGVVQEWNSWVWAAETDRSEELIFHTDGAAQLTKAWPRRVSSAGWVSSCLGSHMMALSDVSWEQRVLLACWSFRPPRHLHQQLSLPQQQQSDSCSKRELQRQVATCRLDRRFDLCLGCNSAKMQGQCQHCHGPTSRVVRGQRYDGCRVLRPSTFAAIQESQATSARMCWRNWAVKA